jgi:hypothetical protein
MVSVVSEPRGAPPPEVVLGRDERPELEGRAVHVRPRVARVGLRRTSESCVPFGCVGVFGEATSPGVAQVIKYASGGAAARRHGWGCIRGWRWSEADPERDGEER